MPTDQPQSSGQGLLRQVKRTLLALNVLSLDAPFVALAWQDLIAHQLDASLLFSQRIVLGLTTWLVYAGDRLLDARPELDSQSRLPRHRFAGRNRRKLLALWGIGAIGNLLLIPVAMSRGAWPVAIGLGIALVLYFLACERFPRIARRLIPRESVVSLFFVTAAFFFPLMNNWPDSWGAGASVFLSAATLYGLAFANCFAIACWERREDARMSESTLATRCAQPAFCLHRVTEAIVLALLVAILVGVGSAVFLTFAMLSAVSLRVTDRRVSPLIRPALADACLLLPWLAVLFS